MNALDMNVGQLTNNAPTLASSAMLIELNISNWRGKAPDKKAAKDVEARNNAENGIVNVQKVLLKDNEHLVALNSYVGKIRDVHKRLTMPWSNSGLRLLPTAQFFNYNKLMTEMLNEFWRLVKEFLDSYNDAVIDVELKMGNLFVRADYPTLEELGGRFNMTLQYTQVPEVGDFRVDLPKEAVDELTATMEKSYNQNYKAAMSDVWTRVHKYLANMSERLDYSDKEDKKKFNDTLVSNVTDMIELLRVCNVSNDSQMSVMANNLEEVMSGITPDALREDDYLRAETKQAVDDAIKALPSLDI